GVQLFLGIIFTTPAASSIRQLLYLFSAEVAKSVDAVDSKSTVEIRAGFKGKNYIGTCAFGISKPKYGASREISHCC
ncbi:hypothetical protein O5824_28180, partial [Escherichia coli]|nr:hypothetical protein [Escherichia coli]